MKKRMFVMIAVLALMATVLGGVVSARAYKVYLPIIAKARPTPTPTRTPTRVQTPTPTETRPPDGCLLKLYLTPGDDDDILSTVPMAVGHSSQAFLFSGASPREWSTTLTGDMAGDRYKFSIYLATIEPSTTFEASIIWMHHGQETTLASTTFTATSTTYTRFEQEMQGPDPATSAGDVLLLRIEYGSGARGGVLSGAPPYRDSHILVPCY